MLTQCSQCKKTYSIRIAELPAHSTVLCCPHCEEMLGRLKLSSPNFFSDAEKSSTHSVFWLIGFIGCLLLFLTQVYFIEFDKFSQNPEQRVWLEKICQSLRCQLPVYKNLNEFEILHGDFQLKSDNHYVFQTVLSNQAEFNQHYPRIRLSLLDFTGHIFAQRVFYPGEYLPTEPTKLMSASETIEVTLNIAPPAQKVGGYTFELI